MIAFIEGKVAEKNPGELIISAGGVGFSLLCSSTTLAAAPGMGESWRCYTVMNVREDAMELFGFATKQEREMFRRLCMVTGVGAKTAQRIVLELKDKVEQQDVAAAPGGLPAPAPAGSAQQEAQAALQALGYTSAEAARAINLVRDQADSTDKLIMLALRQMGSL